MHCTKTHCQLHALSAHATGRPRHTVQSCSAQAGRFLEIFPGRAAALCRPRLRQTCEKTARRRLHIPAYPTGARWPRVPAASSCTPGLSAWRPIAATRASIPQWQGIEDAPFFSAVLPFPLFSPSRWTGGLRRAGECITFKDAPGEASGEEKGRERKRWDQSGDSSRSRAPEQQ